VPTAGTTSPLRRPPATGDPPPAQWDDADAHKEVARRRRRAAELNASAHRRAEGTVAGGEPEPESTGLTEEEATAALAQMTPEERASIQAALANLQEPAPALEDPRGSE
jgi:hypothetical protein